VMPYPEAGAVVFGQMFFGINVLGRELVRL
jgi:hypothetical protein